MLAHPTLNSGFQLVNKRKILGHQQSMRAERDPQVFERKRSFSEVRGLQNILLQDITNPTKINGGFGRVYLQTRNLPKNL
jgi:hypothetical protein